ncbi:hypothetical protein T05_1510 [Trichinella murrelli]|uniref:Uncharacterized protein n=1 Tax=Trichinella murrelli TaxID=144512 RepID=A0A0V0SXJ0_9BILA|nr:hypothetical protein T05_1510 [Trichinella murrelli]
MDLFNAFNVQLHAIENSAIKHLALPPCLRTAVYRTAL